MLKKICFVFLILFVLLFFLTCGEPIEEANIRVPETWETGTTPAGFTGISNPSVFSINPPIAGNYPQGLYQYYYRTGISDYEREIFTQTLEWFPPIHKTFNRNTRYVARLTLDPVNQTTPTVINRTLKGTLQENVTGLPTRNVEKISAEITGESLLIYIVFNPTASRMAAPRIIFEDNFSGTRLDTTKWNTSPEWDRQERSSWRPDMVEVRGGYLRIKFQRDTVLGNAKAQASSRYSQADNANSWIRAGAVRTIGTDYRQRMFEHSYGWYEARIRFPRQQGMWGAFWLMPVTQGSTGRGEISSEIDILESIGSASNRFNHAIHWNFHRNGITRSIDRVYFTNNPAIPNIYDGQFHTFAFDWSPGEYVFYINGIKTWHVIPGEPQFNNIAIAQNPTYIKLSVEAADWDQLLPPGFTSGEMLVDYVRVYNQPRILP